MKVIRMSGAKRIILLVLMMAAVMLAATIVLTSPTQAQSPPCPAGTTPVPLEHIPGGTFFCSDLKTVPSTFSCPASFVKTPTPSPLVLNVTDLGSAPIPFQCVEAKFGDSKGGGSRR